jgi:hypothetical protein
VFQEIVSVSSLHGCIFYTSCFCNLVSGPALDLLDCIDVSLFASHLALSLNLIRLNFVLPSLGCIYVFCIMAGLGSCPPTFFILPFYLMLLLFA